MAVYKIMTGRFIQEEIKTGGISADPSVFDSLYVIMTDNTGVFPHLTGLFA